MKCSLVLVINPGNFVEIELNCFKPELIDRNNLEVLDEFTSNTDSKSLFDSSSKIFNIPEKYNDKNFEIVYVSNGNFREIPFGPCFIENKKFLNVHNIKTFFLENKHNKNMMKRIQDKFKSFIEKYEKSIPYNFSPMFKDFINIINNFEESNLRLLDYIDYFELRSLGMFIAKNLVLEKNNDIEIGNDSKSPTYSTSLVYNLSKKEAA